MRKFYILLAAVATLALSAACSKVVMSADGPGEKAISFEVANYMPRTKANVAFDTGKTFTTYAWSYNREDKPEELFQFMNPATIGYDGSVWKATNRPYYWPKTDSLNFVSYANSPVPEAVMSQDVKGFGNIIGVNYGHYGISTQESTVDPAYVPIGEDDDALLAEAAFHYHWNNGVAWNQVAVTENDPKFTGVPTLFHHLLSKVTIRILFDAKDAQTGYKWNLKVNSASFTCAEKGILQVTFQEPAGAKVPVTIWPFEDNPNNPNNGVWWVRKDELVEKVSSPAVNQKDYEAGKAPSADDAIVLWDDITVLPQSLKPLDNSPATSGTAASNSDANALEFAINFTLTSTYNGGNPIVETLDLTGIPFWKDPQATAPDFAFSTTKDAWKMGHRYIYTITIKPNAAVKFDPATVQWEVADIEYTY